MESGNIKLSRVFSDVFGLTAWLIIKKLVAGVTDLHILTDYIDPRCKSSIDNIKKSLVGKLEEEDRIMLSRMMKHIQSLESIIVR